MSRGEEGNMIVIDVVNDTDSGDYTCNVRSSGRVLGTATYRISNVQGEGDIVVNVGSHALYWNGVLIITIYCS